MTIDYEKLPCKGKFCGRPGLSILPLRIAYVPGGKNELPDPIYQLGDFYFQPMEQGQYMLRTINGGYVYLWDPRSSYGWRAFVATPSGQLKEVPVDDDNRPDDKKPPEFTCVREGHSLEASLINVEEPANATKSVWVGYSRVWWTKDVRKQIKKDDRLREAVMVELNAKEVYEGKHPKPTSGFKIDAEGTKLNQHAIEYRDPARASALFANTNMPAVTAVGNRAKQMCAKMLELSGRKGAVVLALRDPIGMVADIGGWRNQCMGKLTEYHLDENRLWDVTTAQLVDGIATQMKGGSKEYKRYQERINVTKVRSTLRDHESQLSTLQKPIESAAKDWAWWYGRNDFLLAWKTYSKTDDAAAARREEDFALCVDGAGAVPCEQKVIDDCLTDEDIEGKYEAMWAAITYNDKDLVDFLKSNIKPKQVITAGKNLQKLGPAFKDWLKDRKKNKPPSEFTARIGRFMAAQLLRLSLLDPAATERITARVAMTLAARANIVIVAQVQQTTVPRMISELHEVAFGTRQRGAIISVDGAFSSGRQSIQAGWVGTQSEVTSAVRIYGWVPEEAARAAATNAAGHAAGAAGGGRTPQLALPAPPTVLALPAPTPTFMKGLVAWTKSKDGVMAALGGVFTMLGLCTSIMDLTKAVEKGDAKAKRKAVFGVISGSLGVSGLATEVIAGALGKRITTSTAYSANIQMGTRVAAVRLAGAVFATAAAISDGVNNSLKARDQFKLHNSDAGAAYTASAIFFLASGLAGVATTLISIGGGLSTVGVAAGAGGAASGLVGLTSAGTVLLGIPVWGWIVLGLAAMAAGIYFAIKGEEATDTPLEVWFTRCRMRAQTFVDSPPEERDPFDSRESELHSFNEAVFGVTASLTWNGFWKGEVVGRDRLIVQIIMPGFSDDSDYAYNLTLSGKMGTVIAFARYSQLSTDKDLGPQPQKMAELRAGTPREETWATRLDDKVANMSSRPGWADIWRWIRKDRPAMEFVAEPTEPVIELKRNNGWAQLNAEILVDNDMWQQANLKVEYWPDPVRMPEIRATPMGAEGSNMVKAQK